MKGTAIKRLGLTLGLLGLSWSSGWAGASSTAEILVRVSLQLPPTPVVTVAANPARAIEPTLTPGAFIITRNGNTNTSLSVSFSLSGTATGADYQAVGKSVLIPAGASSSKVFIRPIRDSIPESRESVIMTLNSQTGYSLGTPKSATVYILDNSLSEEELWMLYE